MQSTDKWNAWCTGESEDPLNHFKGPEQRFESRQLRFVTPVSKDFLPDSSPYLACGKSTSAHCKQEGRTCSETGGSQLAVSLQRHFPKRPGSSPCLELGTEPRLPQSNYFILWRSDFTPEDTLTGIKHGEQKRTKQSSTVRQVVNVQFSAREASAVLKNRSTTQAAERPLRQIICQICSSEVKQDLSAGSSAKHEGCG